MTGKGVTFILHLVDSRVLLTHVLFGVLGLSNQSLFGSVNIEDATFKAIAISVIARFNAWLHF